MKKEHFVSLKVKVSIGIILICFLMGLLAIMSVRMIATNIIDKEYIDKAQQVANITAATLDHAEVNEITTAVMDIYGDGSDVVPSSEWGSDEWNEYMSKYDGIEQMPVFTKLRDEMRLFQNNFNVDCVYFTTYRKSAVHGIYILDAAYDDACPPGCVDSYEDGVWPDETDGSLPVTVTNTDEYGWLVTAGCPIEYDGEIITYACVDVSMNEIRAVERSYVVTISLLMVGLTVIIIILSWIFLNSSVIRPVAMLSNTAKNYCSEKNNVEHHAFEKLKIRSNDEIGQLLASMKQMETDMNTNINTLVDTKIALKETEDKASHLQALAVKDSLTGIRNKLAYDHEAEKITQDLADGFDEFGLAMIDLNFLKKTNDTYGHEKGNISIRRLCMLVCEVFEHSPVFRIGGDEFIVILKNRDYRNVDSLIDDFNAHLDRLQADDTLQPWEKISAAIGYHKFDKNLDQTVDDVFKKADKAMYDRKVAMKAERKD